MSEKIKQHLAWIGFGEMLAAVGGLIAEAPIFDSRKAVHCSLLNVVGLALRVAPTHVTRQCRSWISTISIQLILFRF